MRSKKSKVHAHITYRKGTRSRLDRESLAKYLGVSLSDLTATLDRVSLVNQADLDRPTEDSPKVEEQASDK